MTDGVRAVVVDPLLKGGDIRVAYFLALPGHGMQRNRACSSAKKRPRGAPGVVRDRTSEETEKRQGHFLSEGPTDTPTFLLQCNQL